MGQRIIRKRTAKEALPRSRKRVPLTDEKREKVLSLAVDGYSIRQIAQACRASKTTVGRWLALLHDDIEKAERKRSKEQAEQKRRESAREQQASLPGEAPREAPRRKLDGNPEHSSQIDESFFPDLPFGGILESRGRPDPPVSFPWTLRAARKVRSVPVAVSMSAVTFMTCFSMWTRTTSDGQSVDPAAPPRIGSDLGPRSPAA